MKRLLLNLFSLLPLVGTAQFTGTDWTIQIGGSGDQEGNDLIFDQEGNVYVTGIFFDTVDFDPGPSEALLISSVWNSAFIAKYGSTGNFIWAKQFDGDMTEYGLSIVVDSAQNVFMCGYFHEGSIDVDPGPDTLSFVSAGDADGYVVKLNENGDLVWAKHLTGTGADLFQRIVVDQEVNIYLLGAFSSTVDFDFGPGNYFLSNPTWQDPFVLKLDSAGNFIWVKQFEGPGGPMLGAWFNDLYYSDETLYLAGFYYDTFDMDPGSGVFDLTSQGLQDACIVVLDSAGLFINAFSMGGVNPDISNTIAVDADFNIYTAGTFTGPTDFDPTSGDEIITGEMGDIYISKIDSAGNFLWVATMGSISSDEAFGITLDSAGNIFTTGYFIGSVDFDPGVDTLLLETGDDGGSDIFILKLDPDGNLIYAERMGGTYQEFGRAIALNYKNEIAITGIFYGTTDLGIKSPMTAVDEYADAFVHKLFQGVLSVTGTSVSCEISIYPNPSNGLFSIESDQSTELIVSNLLGELILSTILDLGENVIDLSDYPAGIYFITLKQDQIERTYKVIKQ